MTREMLLSDRLRRGLCRTAFVLLCLVPTIWTLWHILTPRTVFQWSARMSQVLGIPVRIEAVRTRTPGTTEFVRVALDCEPAGAGVFIDQIVMKNMADARCLHIGTISGTPEAIRNMLERAGTSLRFSLRNDRPVEIRIDHLVLTHAHEKELQFSLRQAFLRHEPASDRTWFHCATDGAVTGEKELSVSRIGDDRQTSWIAESGGNTLPGWVVQGLAPGFAIAADVASVSGNATIYQRATGWSGVFTGMQLHGVDFQRLFEERLGVPWSGHGHVAIEKAVFLDNRLREISGYLTSSGGSVGTRLLEACEEVAGMASAGTTEIDEDVSYSRLEFRFGMRLCQWTLESSIDPAGAIAWSPTGERFLFARNGQSMRLADLFRILAWPADEGSLLTRRTEGLAQVVAWPALNVPVWINESSGQRVAEEPLFGTEVFVR